mmetsp:Transcript_46627/g.146101  ORF Transcript_46627/g.146101 Transcript_46627/m.146101 type:complete len:223 (-) Transcript_46627:232-900(-)
MQQIQLVHAQLVPNLHHSADLHGSSGIPESVVGWVADALHEQAVPGEPQLLEERRAGAGQRHRLHVPSLPSEAVGVDHGAAGVGLLGDDRPELGGVAGYGFEEMQLAGAPGKEEFLRCLKVRATPNIKDHPSTPPQHRRPEVFVSEAVQQLVGQDDAVRGSEPGPLHTLAMLQAFSRTHYTPRKQQQHAAGVLVPHRHRPVVGDGPTALQQVQLRLSQQARI